MVSEKKVQHSDQSHRYDTREDPSRAVLRSLVAILGTSTVVHCYRSFGGWALFVEEIAPFHYAKTLCSCRRMYFYHPLGIESCSGVLDCILSLFAPPPNPKHDVKPRTECPSITFPFWKICILT